MNEHIYKYEVTVYRGISSDEHIYKGVVLADSFTQATDKVVKTFEYREYDCLICDVTIKEYLDGDGDYTDIYVFEEGEK